ncbi:MAG: transglycosylase family protein, partial [Micrococcus sp.]|nr:transglycosylase family protein [Micrococcus sp.]
MGFFTSENSRTRRTSAAVMAGMTLAGAAAVGLSAPANAASVATWDRLAQCESNGNWSINTGNGFYGGLQFSLASWRWVGGSGYPHQASKSEQIARAEILLSRQGWGAWPACSRKLGLTAADAAGSSAVAVDRTAAQQQAAQQQAAAQRQAAQRAEAQRQAEARAAAQRAEAQRQAEARA